MFHAGLLLFFTSENGWWLNERIHPATNFNQFSNNDQVVSIFSGVDVLILGDTQSTALNLVGHFSWHTPHWTQTD
jgi:hypothetical protein